MVCPHCSASDAGPGPFCMVCGQRMTTLPATPQLEPRTDPGYSVSQSSYGYAGSPLTRPVPPSPKSDTMTSNVVSFSIWGPFAGYGTRGRHVSWLINDQGERAEALQDVVAARFERREIPGARIEQVKLTRRGVLVDSRQYFLIRRGLSTAGLYITRFGRDLYVSQVTYFKGPISNFRVLFLTLAIASPLLFPVFTSLFSSAGDQNIAAALALATCLSPLLVVSSLVLTVLIPFSIYKWFTEKDLLAALRVPPNEFDVDDTVALEKSVEETVRESLDEVGIEKRLMPPVAASEFRRRLI